MKENNNKSNDVGFLGILTVAFIVLKLVGVISWSWFLVLSPAILPLMILIITLIVLGIIELIK